MDHQHHPHQTQQICRPVHVIVFRYQIGVPLIMWSSAPPKNADEIPMTTRLLNVNHRLETVSNELLGGLN